MALEAFLSGMSTRKTKTTRLAYREHYFYSFLFGHWILGQSPDLLLNSCCGPRAQKLGDSCPNLMSMSFMMYFKLESFHSITVTQSLQIREGPLGNFDWRQVKLMKSKLREISFIPLDYLLIQYYTLSRHARTQARRHAGTHERTHARTLI